jgi:vancomycin permeability regulator SanA
MYSLFFLSILVYQQKEVFKSYKFVVIAQQFVVAYLLYLARYVRMEIETVNRKEKILHGVKANPVF